jgi:hypothetical protein
MLFGVNDLIQAGDLMAKKRSTPRRASIPEPAAPRWRQVLLLLTIVPMAAGLVLFVAAWADWVFLGSQTGQTAAGALLASFGFAAANALQAKWLLAAGWAALGVAVWLLVGAGGWPWAFWLGIAAGAAGLALLGLEFARRYREVRAQR